MPAGKSSPQPEVKCAWELELTSDPCLSLQLQGVGAHHQHRSVAVRRVRGQSPLALHQSTAWHKALSNPRGSAQKQEALG